MTRFANSTPEVGSDTAILRSAADLVMAARRLVPRFACGTTPLTTAELAELLARCRCKTELVDVPPEEPSAHAVVSIPIGGYHRIGLRSDLSFDERQFALRHEVAHVLAGDADEPVAMVHRGYLTYAERLADLFALADLVPSSYLRSLRSIPLRWNEIRQDLAQMIREQWGADWPEARIDDRAALRLRLFRECGI